MVGKTYTMREMKEIVRYLVENKGYGEIRGRKMWVEFAASGKTSRTWQSLKETFLKRILPDISNPYYELSKDQLRSFRQEKDLCQSDDYEKLDISIQASKPFDKPGTSKSYTESRQNKRRITSDEETEIIERNTNQDNETGSNRKYSKGTSSLKELITYTEPLTPSIYGPDSDGSEQLLSPKAEANDVTPDISEEELFSGLTIKLPININKKRPQESNVNINPRVILTKNDELMQSVVNKKQHVQENSSSRSRELNNNKKKIGDKSKTYKRTSDYFHDGGTSIAGDTQTGNPCLITSDSLLLQQSNDNTLIELTSSDSGSAKPTQRSKLLSKDKALANLFGFSNGGPSKHHKKATYISRKRVTHSHKQRIHEEDCGLDSRVMQMGTNGDLVAIYNGKVYPLVTENNNKKYHLKDLSDFKRHYDEYSSSPGTSCLEDEDERPRARKKQRLSRSRLSRTSMNHFRKHSNTDSSLSSDDERLAMEAIKVIKTMRKKSPKINRENATLSTNDVWREKYLREKKKNMNMKRVVSEILKEVETDPTLIDVTQTECKTPVKEVPPARPSTSSYVPESTNVAPTPKRAPTPPTVSKSAGTNATSSVKITIADGEKVINLEESGLRIVDILSKLMPALMKEQRPTDDTNQKSSDSEEKKNKSSTPPLPPRKLRKSSETKALDDTTTTTKIRDGDKTKITADLKTNEDVIETKNIADLDTTKNVPVAVATKDSAESETIKEDKPAKIIIIRNSSSDKVANGAPEIEKEEVATEKKKSDKNTEKVTIDVSSRSTSISETHEKVTLLEKAIFKEIEDKSEDVQSRDLLTRSKKKAAEGEPKSSPSKIATETEEIKTSIEPAAQELRVESPLLLSISDSDEEIIIKNSNLVEEENNKKSDTDKKTSKISIKKSRTKLSPSTSKPNKKKPSPKVTKKKQIIKTKMAYISPNKPKTPTKKRKDSEDSFFEGRFLLAEMVKTPAKNRTQLSKNKHHNVSDSNVATKRTKREKTFLVPRKRNTPKHTTKKRSFSLNASRISHTYSKERNYSPTSSGIATQTYQDLFPSLKGTTNCPTVKINRVKAKNDPLSPPNEHLQSYTSDETLTPLNATRPNTFSGLDTSITPSNVSTTSTPVSLFTSPEISYVENIAITSSYLDKPCEILNNTVDNADKFEAKMVYLHRKSGLNISTPLMEQDFDLNSLGYDIRLSRDDVATHHPSMSISSIKESDKVLPHEHSTITESFQNDFVNLHVHSPLSKKPTKNNVRMQNDQIRRRKTSSTPLKRYSSARKTKPRALHDEVLMECEECCRNGRKSCPPVILTHTFAGKENLTPRGTPKIRLKQKHKNVIKVKITRPKAKKSVASHSRSCDVTYKIKANVDNNNSECNQTNPKINLTCPVDDDTIHNHSDTCIDAKKFYESDLTCTHRTDFDRRTLPDESSMSKSDYYECMLPTPQNTQDLLTSDSPLLEELPDIFHSAWSLLTDDDSCDSPPKTFCPPPLTEKQLRMKYGDHIANIFPISCTIPDLSTINEDSQESTNKMLKGK